MNRLMGTRELFTQDGAWCFFADPRAIYFAGKHRRTYVGWLTSEGDVRLGYYDHDSAELRAVTVRAALQKDDHANPTLYIDGDGRITIFYSAHGGSAVYFRICRVPEEICELGNEHVLPVNSEGRMGYTYPTPVWLSKEDRLYLFWRGGNYKPTFSICENLSENRWSDAATLIEDSGHRPYIRYTSNGEDAIHFAFTDGHPNAEPTNSIYYACYRNGAYYRSDGTMIKDASGLPLRSAETDVVYDGKAAKRNSWIWDIALDENGFPVMVYAVFVSETDHRYYYSRWNGEEWVTNEITAGGRWFPQTPEGARETETYYSGGIMINHSNPNVVYLSRPAEGRFRIERWTTSDLGRNWSSKAVAEGSATNAAKLQVRPFVSRSAPGQPSLLFWMEGDYIHYTDYNTALYMIEIEQ
jgi:hypothetical protein